MTIWRRRWNSHGFRLLPSLTNFNCTPLQRHIDKSLGASMFDMKLGACGDSNSCPSDSCLLGWPALIPTTPPCPLENSRHNMIIIQVGESANDYRAWFPSRISLLIYHLSRLNTIARPPTPTEIHSPCQNVRCRHLLTKMENDQKVKRWSCRNKLNIYALT